MKILDYLLKYLVKNKELLILISIGILSIFSLFLFFDRPFLFMGDQSILYRPLYHEWKYLLTDFIKSFGKELPMYSWNMFLGSDFYATQFVVFDIFSPLILLFDKVDYALLTQVILCIYIATLSFNHFLEEFGIDDKNIRIIVSILYGFSGWTYVVLGHYMFLRFIAFTPLLLLGFEYYLNRKKSWLFISAIILLITQCYYFMFSTSIFLLIYGVFTTTRRKYKISLIVKIAIKMIGYYLLGALICSIVLVPSILTLSSNVRIGVIENPGLFWNLKTYLGFLLTPIVAFGNFDYNIFYVSANFHDSEFSLFMTIIPITILLDMIFFNYNKYKIYINTFLVLLFIWCLKPLGSMMHGFSNPSLRWGFLFLIFILLMIAIHFEYINKKRCVLLGIIYIIFSFVITFISVYINIIEKIHYQHFSFIILCLIINMFILFIFIKSNKLAIIVSFIFLISSFSFSLYFSSSDYYHFRPTINRNTIEYFIRTDDDLIYRYYIDHSHLLPTHDLNLNDSLIGDYMGVNSYNSLYDFNLVPFLHLNNITYHHLDLNDPDIMPMLGVKYYIVYSESELPESYNFEYVYNIDHLLVYEMEEYQGFGYTTNKLDYFHDSINFKDFTSTLFIDDHNIDISLYQNLQAQQLEVTYKGSNNLKAKIYSKSANILFIPIPNNKGWTVKVNNEVVDTISVNGGFMGIPIQEGQNIIELYFISYGFRLGLVLCIIGIVILVYLLIKENKSSINIFNS